MSSRADRRWRVFNQLTQLHVWAYRLSRGRIGGRLGAAPVLLLHHTGRRTHRERVNPLLYLPDGPDLVIVASKGGSHTHPHWWLNLREMPETTVEVRGERRRVRVAEASDEQRAKLWPLLVDMYPNYDSYQRRSRRKIPVIILTPIAPDTNRR